MKALLDMLRGHGNLTLDSARVLFVLSWIVLVALEFVALVVKEQPFDCVSFASAMSMILGSGAIGVGLKDKWRPNNNENSSTDSK